MALKVAADEYVEPSSKPKKPEPVEEDVTEEEVVKKPEEDPEAEEVHAGTDVYMDYIGKSIQHIAEGYGVVTKCDGKYFDIQFEKGAKAGKTVKYSLEACLSKGLIKVL